MITFKNIVTNNVFTLPKTRAISMITQAPELFEVLSGEDMDVIKKITNITPVDLSKDVYELVVQSDVSIEKVKISKPIKKKVGTKKVKRKDK